LQTPGTPILVARGRPPIPGRAAGVRTHTHVELGPADAVRAPSPPTDSGNARPCVEADQPVAPLTPGDRRCLGSRTGRAGHSEAALAPRDGRGPGHFAERRWL